MNIVWAALVTAAVTAVAIGAMLLVRRNAPDGSYFADGDRASGVFGVLATGFAVLLGFIVVLAFTSYDESRSGAEAEATTVEQQVETAQLLPPATRAELTGELICYGRSVVFEEWPRMRAGTLGDRINPWSVELFDTLRTIRATTPAEQSAYDEWLEQRSTRESARLDRIHGAVGVIPVTLWIVLFFVASVIFGYMLLFADSGEPVLVQSVLMGAVVSVIVTMLFLVSALDNPFHEGVGGLDPVAMQRSLRIIGEALGSIGADVPIPCDARGAPVPV